MHKNGKQKKITVIGGGTGTSVLLSGLKKYPVSLSAVTTSVDEGGSSGILRKEFGMVPPGDIRQCMVALAGDDFAYLNQRFAKGFMRGHTLGNLLIALFYEQKGDIQDALDAIAALLGANGCVAPMTLKPVSLGARLRDGRTMRGEHAITISRAIARSLKKLVLFPARPKVNPRALAAIREADIIVVGPGNLYASLLPNFLVPEIREAFVVSGAKKVYVTNLFTQPGHTDGFSVEDFLRVLGRYIGRDPFTHVIYNTAPISGALLAVHKNKIIGAPVAVPRESAHDNRFIGRAVACARVKACGGFDPLAAVRNPFLHDADALAAAVMEV